MGTLIPSGNGITRVIESSQAGQNLRPNAESLLRSAEYLRDALDEYSALVLFVKKTPPFRVKAQFYLFAPTRHHGSKTSC